MKIKYVHSRVNVNILALTSVLVRSTTVQVPNLALTLHETENSVGKDTNSKNKEHSNITTK